MFTPTPGTGEIHSDPSLICTDFCDYRIWPDSPLIDAGPPDMPLDPDGTPADIGAFPFDQRKDFMMTISAASKEVNKGDVFDYIASFFSVDGNVYSVQFGSGVILPNGYPYSGNPIDGPDSYLVLPNSKVWTQYSVNVPAGAPAGSYTFIGRAIKGGSILDEDSLKLEIY